MKPKFYIGMDVHKASTSYAIRDIEGTIIEEGQCASIGKDVYGILNPYLHSADAGLECNTEVYPLYDYFKAQGVILRVANTVQLRTLIGKNDKLDARRLSDMIRLGTFPQAFIPNEEVRQLRGLVKLRHNIMSESRRIQNQIKALARRNGIRYPDTKELSGKTIAIFHRYMAENPGVHELRYLLDMYSFTSYKLEQLTHEAVEYAKANFPREFEVIISKRGIGPLLATYFISEICPISRFKSEKNLRRYAGVVPCSAESGGKTYATFLPKASSRPLLRFALVQASHCMIKHNENIKAYYRRKKKQKKIAGKAIMSVARVVSDIMFKTLSSIGN